MFRSHRLFTALAAILLALTLFPFSAPAVTENTMESAPEISLPEFTENADPAAEAPEDEEKEDFTYSPYPVILPERGTVTEKEELELPRLTDSELATVKELMAAREAGEQPEFKDRRYAGQEKVFEAGVYKLDPEEFGGHTFYVILPYFQMNRDQLLSLISAFDGLGIPFDPDSLDGTNCARGQSLLSHASTRDLSREEQSRMDEIHKLIRRGILDTDALKQETSCRSVLVQLPGYSGAAYDYLEPFCFYPYRQMTDNELAAFALLQETGWEIHPDLVERKSRQCAHKLFPLPLSMQAREETRYAYDENYIEYRNYFTIDAENCGGLYDSPEETPTEVMVEQNLYREAGVFPEEATFARLLIDYPAMYASRPAKDSASSDEELKAAARRWAERYLLIPAEDILTEWAFDTRSDSWNTVQYRLLTTEYLVCLEMDEKTAQYYQCCIYNRDCAVEFDDWVMLDGKKADDGAEDGTGEQEWEVEPETVDRNARQSAQSVLNIPQEMTAENVSKDEEGYVLYRCDYSFQPGENGGDRAPISMIVYQSPYFTRDTELRTESIFLSYPHGPDGQDRLDDEGFKAAAREWAGKTLLFPAEDILSDWIHDPSGTGGTETYQLRTRNWTVYLQMDLNGEYRWCGLYVRRGAD